MPIAPDITALVGCTPMARLVRLDRDLPGRIAVKLESLNPLASVKDRVALGMVEAAERDGRLRPGVTVVEPTSGNTGIGLAFVCASRGYDLVIFLPDTMSTERRKLLRALGAELVLTPGAEGMKGAIARARERVEASPDDHLMLMQFDNPANPGTHARTTAEEIWHDTGGELGAFVSAVGTGGTITGVARVLKERDPSVRIVAMEPAESPVLSGGEARPHRIQGMGAGFVPEVLDLSLVDEILRVDADEAACAARMLASQEGILAGISSGAALHGAVEVASRPEMEGRLVVALLPDTGERYLSTWLFQDLDDDEGGR